MIFVYPAAGIGIVVIFILGAAFARTYWKELPKSNRTPPNITATAGKK